MRSITALNLPSQPRRVPGDDAAQRLLALQHKLDAIRDYVSICAADELEPVAILEIIDTEYRQR